MVEYTRNHSFGKPSMADEKQKEIYPKRIMPKEVVETESGMNKIKRPLEIVYYECMPSFKSSCSV
jgi:hypothetical protein